MHPPLLLPLIISGVLKMAKSLQVNIHNNTDANGCKTFTSTSHMFELNVCMCEVNIQML